MRFALAGLLYIVIGTEMCGDDTNIFEVTGELIFEPRSIVEYIHIITFCKPSRVAVNSSQSIEFPLTRHATGMANMARSLYLGERVPLHLRPLSGVPPRGCRQDQ